MMNLCSQETRFFTPTSEMDRLADLIQNRVSRRIRNLRLICDEGGIVLHGQAPSFYVKQIAQQAVMEATDMPILANDIEVG